MSDEKLKKTTRTKELTPEEKQQRLERISRNRKIRSLFDEYDVVYGKKRYMPNVPKLLIFLRDKKNAKAFWENPHINMIYNVSDHLNFLLSIYTQETDKGKYEKWLRNHFSNPFFDKVVVNFEMIQNYYGISDSDKEGLCSFLMNLTSFLKYYNDNNTVGYESFKRKLMDKHEKIVQKYKLMKYVPLDSLLDRDCYQDLIKTDCQLPESIIFAQSSVQNVDKILNELYMQLNAEEINFLEISKNLLLVFEKWFYVNALFRKRDYSSPERMNLRGETFDEYRKLLVDDPVWVREGNDDDYFNKKYKFSVERYNNLSKLNERYRSEMEMIARESANKVLFLHPLIAMDNTFLRLDVYNVWKNTHKKQWPEVIKKDLGRH